MEPDHGAMSRAWSWRHAVGKSGLPPITRLVLHTLGLKMDATGGSCYPPISELVDLTGLDKKTVLKHLDVAEENGWISVTQHGFRGQKWKRNEYTARWPGRDLAGHAADTSPDEGGGAVPPRQIEEETAKGGGAVPPRSDAKAVEMVPEGGGNDDRKVVEELHQDKNLPTNIPSNSPAAGAGEGVLKKSDRQKIEQAFTLWYATWKKGNVEFARNAWFALSAEERAECIQRTPAYLRWKPSEVMAAAVYLKNKHWRDMPEHLATAPEKTHGIAKVCGKLWMGTWLETVLGEPDGVIVFSATDERQIASGDVTRQELFQQKRKAYGWTKASRMRSLAQSGEKFITSLVLLPKVDGFRQVHRDSELFAAWERAHERRGWPCIGEVVRLPSVTEYPWFPPVDEAAANLDMAVDAAIAEYERQLTEGRNDDAA
jgi:hypothetical protein